VAGLTVLSGYVSFSDAEPRKITKAEKKFCADAYHKYCGEYGLESTYE
jgi:hypothetical protein